MAGSSRVREGRAAQDFAGELARGETVSDKAVTVGRIAPVDHQRGGWPGLDGLVIAAGFSGMGFKISPAIGRAIASLILDGTSSPVDIAAFRPSRFAEGHPITPPHPYEDD
jgi:glycine/D-amino acid oxidase-like deaminating enzyme